MIVDWGYYRGGLKVVYKSFDVFDKVVFVIL